MTVTLEEYQTLGGFDGPHRPRPHGGREIRLKGWRFEVVDMDGLRVDKVLLSPSGRWKLRIR